VTPTDLVEARDQLRLSQVGLARALGIAANTVNRWEAGTRSIPPYLPLAIYGLRHHRHEYHDSRSPYAEPCCPRCCDCGAGS